MKFVPPVHYSRSFSGYIWKIKVDSVSNKVWVEVRNEDSFELNFFWVSLETLTDGRFSCDPPLKWWDSLLHVYADQICIQHITDTKNPGPVDLSVIKASDMTLRDGLQQVSVESISESFFQYKMGDSSKIVTYDLGEENRAGAAKIQCPVVYPEDHAHCLTVARYLQESFQIEISGPVAYLESANNIIVAYHSKNENALQRNILWLKDGRTHLHEVMDQKMKGYSRESFFTFSNYLIFIENRINLSIYQLNIEK